MIIMFFIVLLNCISAMQTINLLFKDVPMQQDTGTQQSCLQYLEKIRWGKNVQCPYCLSNKTHPSKNTSRHFCYNCIKSFSVLVGTVFEDTRLPLPVWFNIIKAMLKSKKIIPAKALAKENGIPVKTVWLTTMKIRCAMTDGSTILCLKAQRNLSKNQIKKPEKAAINMLQVLKQYVKPGNEKNLKVFLETDEGAALFFSIHLEALNQTIMRSKNESHYLQTIMNKSINFLNSNFSAFYFSEFEYKFKRRNKKYGFFTEYLRNAVCKEPFIKTNASKVNIIQI